MKQNRMEELQLPERYRKLIRRLRRGGIIFFSLSLVFGACACAALVFHWGISWAISAFIMSLVCRLTLVLSVGRKYVSAWKVAENPEIVYWAHSLDGQGRAIDKPLSESKNVRLHLKDGTQLEVEAVRGTGTTQDQLREVISWLSRCSPSTRLGNYDQPCTQ